MKKTLILITLLCIVVASNAQTTTSSRSRIYKEPANFISGPQTTPGADSKIVKEPNHAVNAQQAPITHMPGVNRKQVSAAQTEAMHHYVQSKNAHSTERTTTLTPVSNWYDQWDQNYMSGISTLFYFDVYQDSNLIDNTTGPPPYYNIDFHGMGMSFDPTDSSYSYSSLAYAVTPAMPDTGTTYTVDSIAFFYKYMRNNTAAVGDSLIIEVSRTQSGAVPPDSGAYALQFPANSFFINYCYDSAPRYASLRYDMLRNDCADSSLLTTPGERQRIAIPLTAATFADTLANGANYFKQALGASGILITPGTYCAAYVYFKSGVTYPAGTDASTANYVRLYAGEPLGYTTPFKQSSANSIAGYPGSYNDALVATSQIEYNDTGFVFNHHNILIPSYAYYSLSGSTGFDVFYMQFHVTYNHCMPTVLGTITGTFTICPGSPSTLTDTSAGGTWRASNAHATVSSGGVVTAVTSGVDTIFYTVTDPCGTSSVSAVINVGMNAGTISGIATICPTAHNFYLETIGGGTWSLTNAHASIISSGEVTGISAGVDTVLYIITGSCGSDTAFFPVTVLPATSAGIITGDTILCTGSSVTLSDIVSGGTWVSATGLIHIMAIGSGTTAVATASVSGTGFIKYEVTGTCGTAIDSIHMTVLLSPLSAHIYGDTTACVGALTTLYDSISGGTWTASNGNALITTTTGVVRGSHPGLDTIHYYATNACGSDTNVVVISVHNMPNAGVITAISDTVCIDSFLILNDTATGGIWSGSAPANAIVYPGEALGSSVGPDTVFYSLSNACGSAEATLLIYVKNCSLAIDNLYKNSSEITVFPNPALDNITISSAVEPIQHVVISNLLGKNVYSASYNTQHVTISLDPLLPGIYIVTVNTNTYLKLVKQ